jgi:hypothetical protein
MAQRGKPNAIIATVGGLLKQKNDLFLVSIWKNEDAIFLGLLHEFEKYIESGHVQVGFNKPHELLHVVFRLN